MQEVQIVAGEPPTKGRRALLNALLDYNRRVTGIAEDEEFSAFLHDGHESLVAGIYGWVFGGTGEVALLWVREDRRSEGLGSRLLGAAEDHARAVGCTQMVIRTHSFQAPEFYRGHGYVEAGAVNDYPRGHRYYLLVKPL
jgi:GNAT superfamily N-acetyltransferase